jgi:hypothetical protein
MLVDMVLDVVLLGVFGMAVIFAYVFIKNMTAHD